MKRHVMNDKLRVTYCGAKVTSFDWYFVDASHVIHSVGGSIPPCKKCIKAIIKELKKEL